MPMKEDSEPKRFIAFRATKSSFKKKEEEEEKTMDVSKINIH